MSTKQNYVEIELIVQGHTYKKRIYDTKVYFVKLKNRFGGLEYICYQTHQNCGKPVWFKDKDLKNLYKTDIGIIELKQDGTYTITKLYNPLPYIERFIKSKLRLI